MTDGHRSYWLIGHVKKINDIHVMTDMTDRYYNYKSIGYYISGGICGAFRAVYESWLKIRHYRSCV